MTPENTFLCVSVFLLETAFMYVKIRPKPITESNHIWSAYIYAYAKHFEFWPT
jgi:hypothetical protein